MKIPSLNPEQKRAAGALLGAFIGDAMSLGPHWYYDLDEQHRDYGTWITDYTTPKPDRYHGGLKAGDLSQAGLILKLTVESLVSCSGYDEADFCRRPTRICFLIKTWFEGIELDDYVSFGGRA